MTEEQDVDIEFEEQEETEDDYDIAIQHGSVFIMDATNFFQKYNVEAVWVDVDAGPIALVEGKGAMSFNELAKDAAKRKLKPV